MIHFFNFLFHFFLNKNFFKYFLFFFFFLLVVLVSSQTSLFESTVDSKEVDKLLFGDCWWNFGNKQSSKIEIKRKVSNLFFFFLLLFFFCFKGKVEFKFVTCLKLINLLNLSFLGFELKLPWWDFRRCHY